MSETLSSPAQAEQQRLESTAFHHEALNELLATNYPHNVEMARAFASMAKAADVITQHPTEGVSIAPDGTTIDQAVAEALSARAEAGVGAYTLSDETRERWEAYAKGGPLAVADEAQRDADVQEYTRHKYPIKIDGQKSTKPAFDSMEQYAKTKLSVDRAAKRFLEHKAPENETKARPQEPVEKSYTVKDKRHGRKTDSTEPKRPAKHEAAEPKAPEKRVLTPTTTPEAAASKAAKAAEQKAEHQAAANARVEEIIAAKKFQLGSHTVERAGYDQQITRDARAQAAREGHDISHLQGEDGADEGYHGKHRVEDLDSKRPADLTEEQWNMLTDQEKADLASALAAGQAGTTATAGSNQPAGQMLEKFSENDSEQDSLRKKMMHELPKELAEELAWALNDYTTLAAMRQRTTLWGGKVKSGGKVTYQRKDGTSVTVDGHKIEADRATAEAVEAARQRYEKIRREVKQWEVAKMQENGLKAADRVMISKLQDITEAKMIKLGIEFEAVDATDRKRQRFLSPEEQSKSFKARTWFLNKWASWGGGNKFWSKQRLAGMAKKGAFMSAIGLPVGIAAGAAGVFLAGPLVGGAFAAAAARGMTRGLMRGHIEKNTAARTVAHAQAERQLQDQLNMIDAAYMADEHGDVRYAREVSSAFAEGTDRSVSRNRKRMVGGVAIGLASGLVGSAIGEAIHGAVWGGHHGGSHPAVQNNNPRGDHQTYYPGAESATQPPVRLELGHSGDSIWAETVNYAQQHGVNLSEGQKEHIVREILKTNGQTWESARHLPLGYHFNISPEELEEILSKKAA